jgi:tRNA modification GTPase
VAEIAGAIVGRQLAPRRATFVSFLDQDAQAMDTGIALYFAGPASFTGEDVLELQGHGGPVVMDMLLGRVIDLGARLAEPGEFSRRAFLNDKLDLAQAEAVADLIDSQTRAAARSAVRSLNGVFSERVHALTDAVTGLRVYVEAAIDFPEEEIDFLADEHVHRQLDGIIDSLGDLKHRAHTGQLLRDGLSLVIAGRPNAGKSSLLNALTGQERAIVTAIPGTTRDLLREQIEIDGLPIHLVDTAGLRDAGDAVEQEGVRRAREQLAQADHALWVFDGMEDPDDIGFAASDLPPGIGVTRVRNKVDLSGNAPRLDRDGDLVEIALSAKTGTGVDLLRDHLKQLVAYEGTGEGEFSARRRHLEALDRVGSALLAGREALLGGRAGELLAEDLRQAQLALTAITGEFTADDLLGEIFSSFCIGK